MNSIILITLLSLGVAVSGNVWGGYPHNSWKWEAPVQNWNDWNRWDNWNRPWNYESWNNKWNFAPAPLGPDGRVVDTPEVERAKAEHFAAKEQAIKNLSQTGPSSPLAPAQPSKIESIYPSQIPPIFATPTQTPVASLPPSNLAPWGFPNHPVISSTETPPNLAPWGNPSQSVISSTVAPPNYVSWGHGMTPYGPAPLGPDGRVIDTPEVAKAKEEHFAAFAAALKRPSTTYAPNAPVMYGSWTQGAAPLGPDGRVIDTPEVAHAKAVHYAAKAAAAQSYGFNRFW